MRTSTGIQARAGAEKGGAEEEEEEEKEEEEEEEFEEEGGRGGEEAERRKTQQRTMQILLRTLMAQKGYHRAVTTVATKAFTMTLYFARVLCCFLVAQIVSEMIS